MRDIVAGVRRSGMAQYHSAVQHSYSVLCDESSSTHHTTLIILLLSLNSSFAGFSGHVITLFTALTTLVVALAVA